MKEPIKINPMAHSFFLRFSERDCFKLRTGKCPLPLTEKEHEEYLKQEENEIDASGRVGHCRAIASSMILDDFHLEYTGIELSHKACGHVQFTDGQHRTCVARRLGYTILALLHDHSGSNCQGCNFKDHGVIADNSFFNDILAVKFNAK